MSAAAPTGGQVGRIEELLGEVGAELARALALFPAFNSPHEGKAVIEEELDELWKHVKENTGRSPAAMREAIQLAAMGLRYVYDLQEREGAASPRRRLLRSSASQRSSASRSSKCASTAAGTVRRPRQVCITLAHRRETLAARAGTCRRGT